MASSDRYEHRAQAIGGVAIYLALAVIYCWFGGMKFTAYEAEGLVPLVSNSPLLSWMYDLLGQRGFAYFLGVLELVIGVLLLCRVGAPTLSAIGAALSLGLFFVTISFIATTPGVFEPKAGGFPALSVSPGQFLLKDIGLFAASLWALGESLTQAKLRSGTGRSDGRRNRSATALGT